MRRADHAHKGGGLLAAGYVRRSETLRGRGRCPQSESKGPPSAPGFLTAAERPAGERLVVVGFGTAGSERVERLSHSSSSDTSWNAIHGRISPSASGARRPRPQRCGHGLCPRGGFRSSEPYFRQRPAERMVSPVSTANRLFSDAWRTRDCLAHAPATGACRGASGRNPRSCGACIRRPPDAAGSESAPRRVLR